MVRTKLDHTCGNVTCLFCELEQITDKQARLQID